MLTVLTGLPGAGKSTVGRMLAERLGSQFYDVDETLPEELKAINRRGEFISQQLVDDYFQNVVLKDIRKMHDKGNVVMSAVLAREDHMTALKEKFSDTVFIYLKAPKKVLLERVNARLGHFVNDDVVLRAYGSEFDLRPSKNVVRSDKPLEEVVEECMQLIEMK